MLALVTGNADMFAGVSVTSFHVRWYNAAEFQDIASTNHGNGESLEFWHLVLLDSVLLASFQFRPASDEIASEGAAAYL